MACRGSGGGLPRAQHRMVEAWAEVHQGKLRDDRNTLQEGRLPKPIQPLS
ncbi:MAG: DUF4160 domain-containing protein [Acidobacteriia bacterium]|nr:DUF4160 domain-containing protein [Terriglobia bacterium]